MKADDLIKAICDELQEKALPFDIYAYEVKATHQIIRKNVEAFCCQKVNVDPKKVIVSKPKMIKENFFNTEKE